MWCVNLELIACCSAMQKFAAHYTSCVFLKFFGNASENTKYLFRDRLQTPLTPTFSFWRRGKLITALAARLFGLLAIQAGVVSAQPHTNRNHV